MVRGYFIISQQCSEAHMLYRLSLISDPCAGEFSVQGESPLERTGTADQPHYGTKPL